MSDFMNVMKNGVYNGERFMEGSLYYNDTSLRSMGLLKRIKGDLDVYGTKIEDLGALEVIEGEVDFRYTELTSLSKLYHVGRDIRISHTKIKSLAPLKYIGGDLIMIDNYLLEDISSLELVENILYGRDNKDSLKSATLTEFREMIHHYETMDFDQIPQKITDPSTGGFFINIMKKRLERGT